MKLEHVHAWRKNLHRWISLLFLSHQEENLWKKSSLSAHLLTCLLYLHTDKTDTTLNQMIEEMPDVSGEVKRPSGFFAAVERHRYIWKWCYMSGAKPTNTPVLLHLNSTFNNMALTSCLQSFSVEAEQYATSCLWEHFRSETVWWQNLGLWFISAALFRWIDLSIQLYSLCPWMQVYKNAAVQ